MPFPFMAAAGLASSLLGGLFGSRKDEKSKRDFYRQLDAERGRQRDQGEGLYNHFYDRLGGAEGRSDELYGDLRGGYNRLLGPDWRGEGGGGGNSGGGGGGGSTSPNYEGGLNSTVDWYKNLANNPIDEEGIRRSRGGGVFDEFARTGGWDDKRKADYLAKATSVIPSIYGNFINEMNRKKAVTGGGIGNSDALLLREQARAGQDAQRDADLGLASSIDEGRKWGSSSMSGAELNLQDLMSRTKLGAMGGAAQTELGLLNAQDARNAASAANGLGWAGLDLQRQLAALNGLGELRGQVPGEVNMYNNDLMQTMFGTNQSQNDLMRMRMPQSNSGGFWGNFGRAGQVAAPFISAFGSGSQGSGSSWMNPNWASSFNPNLSSFSIS